MKKLKNILCFAVVWVWLLFNSFTFADTFNFWYKYSCVTEANSYISDFHCSTDLVWCSDHIWYNSDSQILYVYSNSSLSSVVGCSSLSLLSNWSITLTCNNWSYACSESFLSNWDDWSANTQWWIFQWNVIQSANWAKLLFSDTALAQWIWQPIFNWWANIINLAIKFFPVMLVIAFFWLMLSALKNLWKIRKEKKDKDLSNK